MRTFQMMIDPTKNKKDAAFCQYFKTNTADSKCMYNTANFYIRNTMTGIKKSPEAVSYTHLDVYKRQTVNDNIDSDESDSNMVDNPDDADSSGDLTVNDSDKMAIGETEIQDSENSDGQNEDVIDSASAEKSTDTTDNNTPGDSVEPVSIDNFKVLFVSGADNIDDQAVWNP